jgi:hypothetical protein
LLSSLNPFARIEARPMAIRFARRSAWAFLLGGVMQFAYAGAIWFYFDHVYAIMQSGVTTQDGALSLRDDIRNLIVGWTVVIAWIFVLLAGIQWRWPNRMLSVLGLAATGYYFSSAAVSLALGVAGSNYYPMWVASIGYLCLLIELPLHIAGLRGSAAMARDGLKA